MTDVLKTIRQIEETRDKLHDSLTEDKSTTGNETLAVSKELDNIINLYYQSSNSKGPEVICMICSGKMRRKSG